MIGRVTGRQGNRHGRAIVAVLVAGALVPALAPSSASAVVATPWQYFAGFPFVAPGTVFSIAMLNQTSTQQTVSIVGVTHTLTTASQFTFTNACPPSPPNPCLEPADFRLAGRAGQLAEHEGQQAEHRDHGPDQAAQAQDDEAQQAEEEDARLSRAQDHPPAVPAFGLAPLAGEWRSGTFSSGGGDVAPASAASSCVSRAIDARSDS
jgi:hypothetical protein